MNIEQTSAKVSGLTRRNDLKGAAATAATIISGAIAGRVKFSAYLMYTPFITGFIYPIVTHWVWGGGWLGGMGALDFAGGTVVHISSGVSALICALFLKKRLGYPKEPMPPHSVVLSTIGACLLWVGWFGFNAGSALGAVMTRASHDADGLWTIRGSKCFITNGTYADWFTVYAKTDPDAGSKGMTAFLIEKDFKGLVVGNDSQNFSVGANIALILMAAIEGEYEEIDLMVRQFQRPQLDRLGDLACERLGIGGECLINGSACAAGAQPGRFAVKPAVAPILLQAKARPRCRREAGRW